MADNSKIEWTNTTWNPVTGCSKISEGCRYCYAERMACRLNKMGNRRYLNGFNVTLHHDLIDRPYEWQKSRFIFVNSMSDLFHEDVPFDFIYKVFNTMANTEQHIYQVLTKRSHRLLELSDRLPWKDNIWIGVSVENNDVIHRIQDIKKVPAKIKFLSCEPLIGEIKPTNLSSIDWVIVGGESGPNARPMKEAWVEGIYQMCKDYDVPFFFKQWGGVQKWKTGRLFHNKQFNEMPHMLSQYDNPVPQLVHS